MSEIADPLAAHRRAGHDADHDAGRFAAHDADHVAEHGADRPADPCAGFRSDHLADDAGRADPAPVLGPYLGVVGAVLSGLVGAFLLLAPFAFDYRDGAAKTPRATVVDLVTGGSVLLLGLVTAALFGTALARRLRVADEPDAADTSAAPQYASQSEAEETAEPFFPGSEPHEEPAEQPAEQPAERPGFLSGVASYPESEPEPARDPGAPPPQGAGGAPDPAGALRDLLTPLVAALAADLRARENPTGSEGRQL